MRRALSFLLLAAACGSGQVPSPQPAPAVTAPEAPPAGSGAASVAPVDAPTKPVRNTTLQAIGLDPAALDRTADPCDDFYQFSCGGWIAATEIAADRPIAMRSFVDIDDRNYAYERELLEKTKATPETAPIMDKLTAFYGSCMDTASIDKAGLAPVKPLLATIAKVKDPKTLSAAIIQLQVAGASALFAFGPTEDFANAQRVIAGIDQAGLGLPDRDYYLQAEHQPMREAYLEYVAALLVEAGHKPDAAKREATEVLALESELAGASKDKVAMRDPKGIYNKIDRVGVAREVPHFDWDGLWKAVGLPQHQDVTVSALGFLAGIEMAIVKTKPEVWRNYLVAFTLGDFANMLSQRIEGIRFKLDAKLTGAAEQKPRWKRCVDQVDGKLGDLLGQMFVRDRFAGASKAAAEAQVKAISEAMKKNLDELPWMDAATKQKAYAKLAAMAYNIGYPTKWREYTFKIDRKAFGANALAGRRAEAMRQFAKIGKPVDRDDWGMSAPTVNAYYNPLHNKMVFPAGILQPPFYAVGHSIPVNLGAMGMVVGHELTHGFDDQGSQFDAAGNMTNWWQPQTGEQFKQRTQCVIEQYGKYTVAGGAKVNGALTVGENIADIGGVKLARSAYRALTASAPDTAVADGFTEDQQFFISFAQAWCAKARPEYEAMLTNVDPHSPPRWRVNGALSATPDFAKAFRCKAGTKLRPANACVVW